MEAYEKMLDSWMTLLLYSHECGDIPFKPQAVDMFNSYLQCHLSVPDGIRNQVTLEVHKFINLNIILLPKVCIRMELSVSLSMFLQQTSLFRLIFNITESYIFQHCISSAKSDKPFSFVII